MQEGGELGPNTVCRHVVVRREAWASGESSKDNKPSSWLKQPAESVKGADAGGYMQQSAVLAPPTGLLRQSAYNRCYPTTTPHNCTKVLIKHKRYLPFFSGCVAFVALADLLVCAPLRMLM
jgi:hypothetical protein